MKMHDLINDENVDSQVVGIIVTIPMTGVKKEPIIITHKVCEKCDREEVYGNFCKHCGGKIVEKTEPWKYGNETREQEVPQPDVREEMKALGMEYHLPMEISRYQKTSKSKAVYTDTWKFVYKSYALLGHRSHYRSFVEKLDLAQIQKDLEEAKQKLKPVLKKYKGSQVIFGIAGQHTDW